MKRPLFIMTILILTVFFPGCSNSLNMDSNLTAESIHAAKDGIVNRTQDIKFPDTIELQYKEIELDSILQAGDLTLLKKEKTAELGKVDGEQINISLYSDKDNNIHGVFSYKGKEYILNYLGYANYMESIEIHKLQLVYNADGKNTILVSGIGSPILGYQYILFNESNNKWSSFHNWGTPGVLDINHDGTREVLLHFSGMHLQTPDLYILSFHNGSFMITDINSEVYRNGKLDTMKSKIASSYINGQYNEVLVEISDLMSSETPFLYHLEYDGPDSSILRLGNEIQTSQLSKS